jgi:hypothetical protein
MYSKMFMGKMIKEFERKHSLIFSNFSYNILELVMQELFDANTGCSDQMCGKAEESNQT